MRFYVNGKLNNVISVRGHIEGYAPTDGMGIGGEFGNVNPVFCGRISEVAVYDRTLTPGRIETHYLAGLRPTAKNRLQMPVAAAPNASTPARAEGSRAVPFCSTY